MAQVPYSPVPDVGMQDIPTPGVRVSGEAISGASGENIGKAISHFGDVLANSGKELYRTAMHMQEVKNQAEANEADANYSLGLADLQVKFASQEGRAPADNLMSYKDEVNALRLKIREGMSNDASRRLYDRHALNSMVIAVRGGASHAAAQLKQYSKAQSSASAEMTIREAYDNPNDPIDYQLAKIERIIRESSKAVFEPQEQVDLKVAKGKEAVVAARIDGMNREKPVQAQELLNDAIANKWVGGEIAGKLQDKVTAKLIDVEGRNIADTVLSDPTVVTEKEALDRARAEARERSEDPRVIDSAVSKTEAKFNQRERVKRDGERRDWETVLEGIMSDKVVTVDDLLKVPGAEAAIERLPASKRKTIQTTINAYNNARDKPINDEEMKRIIGMRGGTMEQRKEFMELKPTELPLNQAQMKQVAAWQKADAKQVKDNPHVTQAKQWIKEAYGAELTALKINRRIKDQNDKEYDRFEGAISVAIDFWKQDKGKYPTHEEVVKIIAPSLIKQTISNYGWFGWGSEAEPGGRFVRPGVKDKALVEKEVPPEFEEKLRAKVRKEEGVELDAPDVQRAYWRFLLEEERRKREGK